MLLFKNKTLNKIIINVLFLDFIANISTKLIIKPIM